jgi:pyruvate,water dikinase
MNYIKPFSDISLADVPLVGGKTASLGEMFNRLTPLGIKIPNGFAITAEGYWFHLKKNNLQARIEELLVDFRDAKLLGSSQGLSQLYRNTEEIRALIIEAPLPKELVTEITAAYEGLSATYGTEATDVAVRSSATAEDLPNASFAGQQETYLNIRGIEALLTATKKCMASLFTDRAIVYRIEQGFDHFQIGLSVAIQKMVRSDKASSGVSFSLDTETGFKDIVVITSSYGLGENVVKGTINPDEFQVHKPTLAQGFRPIVKKYLGSKEMKLVYEERGESPTVNIPVAEKERQQFSISDEMIIAIASQTALIEGYYTKLKQSWCPMDIEWAIDGIDHALYIVQARPETVYSQIKWADELIHYKLKETPSETEIITTGLSIGQKIAHGVARIVKDVHEQVLFNKGDILVTRMTDPDWVPLMKKASAIVTDQGGRTCHAAIVSRELGIPAIIGTTNGTKLIKNGEEITADCSGGSTGVVYKGLLQFDIQETVLTTLPKPRVPVLLNIADPERAYKLSFLPVSGVGLARMEFIITSAIKVHPMAICQPEKITNAAVKKQIAVMSEPYDSPETFYIDTLAQGIGRIVAAFYPRDVIVRLSDFKSNEYRNLLAGSDFEPIEENPMLGFRGAVRYCDPSYAPAFELECKALNKVRHEMGLTNMKLLVPFVRNLYEAGCTIAALEKNGIKRGDQGLKILMMCEIPSNVILLEEFSAFFDGFSIGSNDLTQFTLAVDRDSAFLSPLFNERDPAALAMFKLALERANKIGAYMSICGQAPSDFPEVADFLIDNGIDAISLNPDSVIPFLINEGK